MRTQVLPERGVLMTARRSLPRASSRSGDIFVIPVSGFEPPLVVVIDLAPCPCTNVPRTMAGFATDSTCGETTGTHAALENATRSGQHVRRQTSYSVAQQLVLRVRGTVDGSCGSVAG